jgi:hypothetical protein
MQKGGAWSELLKAAQTWRPRQIIRQVSVAAATSTLPYRGCEKGFSHQRLGWMRATMHMIGAE